MGRMAKSDPSSKLIFSDLRAVGDLLRGFVAPDWHGEMNFATLTKQPLEFIGEALHQRIGNMAFTLELKTGRPLPDGRQPYLALLLEFRSRKDQNMGWRVSEHAHLLHRQLHRSGVFRREGRMPPVLPAVLHDGARPWPAGPERPAQFLRAPGNGTLPRHLLGKAYVLLDEVAWVKDGAPLPQGNRISTLIRLDCARREALPDLLAAAFQCYDGEDQAGFREGCHARVEERLRRGGGMRLPSLRKLEQALACKRGGKMASLLEASTSEWRRELLEQGQAQGMARGIEQGRADERALLARQATRRFGATTGRQLSGLLKGFKSAQELAAVGDWIVDCETSADLLGRVRSR